MKAANLTLTLALATTFAAAAQSQPVAIASATPAAKTAAAAPASPAPDAFTAAMLPLIAAQNAAVTPADFQANLAQLERAVSAAPTAWEPRYYQARACLRLGFMSADGDAQDKFFDRAQAALDQAKKLPRAEQAELLILQAYLYQGRIMVSPMTRGMIYSGRVSEALSLAEAGSPGNPRVALLRGNDLFYRPSMFGGGADKAKPFYQLAVLRFVGFQPATPLSPTWGAKMAAAMLAKASAAPAGDTSPN